MSGSAIVGADWSDGLVVSERTSFQVNGGGAAWIATGDTAPSENKAGNLVPSPYAVEITSGKTVYWRTDEKSPIRVSWLEVGD
jgi:hypothetical protein